MSPSSPPAPADAAPGAAELSRRGTVHATVGSGNYAILLAVLTMVVLLSGIGASKGVIVGPIITDGGFWLFPLAYVLGDVITEVYGLRAARRAIIVGFAANILAVISYAVIIALPGFDDPYGIAKQQALEGALGPVWRIVVASLLGFAAGMSANSAVMWWGKRRTGERRLLSRLVGSTGVGELLDTVVFCTIAAPVIGITTLGQWANYTGFGFLYKVAVQYLMLPVTTWVIAVLKRREPSYQAALRAASPSPAPRDSQVASAASDR